MNNTVRRDIARLYAKRMPRVGPELEQFIEKNSEYYSVPARDIRKVVAEAQQAYELQFSLAIKSSAQNVADVAGGSIADAVNCLVDALQADKQRPIIAKDGTPVEDAEGNVKFIRTPDFSCRITAAKALIDIHGANAPKHVKVESHVHRHDDNLTSAQLLGELDGIRAALVRDAEFAVLEASDGAGSATDRPGEVEAGGEGRVLLGDAMYAVDRRTGPQRQPLQAVPGA